MKAGLAVPVLLLAVAGGAATAAEPVDVDYRDWTLVCDNGGDCSAFGLMRDEASPAALQVVLHREPGSHGGMQLRLIGLPRDATALALDGRGIALPLHGWDWSPEIDDAGRDPSGIGEWASDDEAAIRELVATVRNGLRLHLATDPEEFVSLAGLGATLLRMDEVQGRVGTQTALFRRGPAPAGAVPPAPSLPVVPAAPYRDRALTDAERALAADLARAQVRFGEDECWREEYGDAQDLVEPLSPGLALVLMECLRGAYQSSYVPVRVELRSRRAERVRLPNLPGRPPFEAVVFGEYEPGNGRLSHFSKYRGLADCGESAHWLWNGREFQLAALNRMRRCAGYGLGDYPPLWRTSPGPPQD
jgi:hypothetical protein